MFQSESEVELQQNMVNVQDELLREFKQHTRSQENDQVLRSQEKDYCHLLDTYRHANRNKKKALMLKKEEVTNAHKAQLKETQVRERSQHHQYELLLKFWAMHQEEKHIQVDYSEPEKNIGLYNTLLANINYKYMHKEEERDQLNYTIDQLNQEIAHLNKYQEEAENTLALAQLHEGRMESLREHGTKERKNEYKRQLKTVVGKQNRYFTTRQESFRLEQDAIQFSITEITQGRMKNSKLEARIEEQQKQIGDINQTIERKVANRFSVAKLIRMVECMDVLGSKSPDYLAMMKQYSQKVAEYDDKAAILQVDKHYLVNRLEEFYKKYDYDLPALKNHIINTFNSLSGQYQTLSNRHMHLISTKKASRTQLHHTVSLEQIEQSDSEWVAQIKAEGKWIPDLLESQEKMTIQDWQHQLQNVQGAYMGDMAREQEAQLVKLFFHLYNNIGRIYHAMLQLDQKVGEQASSSKEKIHFLGHSFKPVQDRLRRMQAERKYGALKARRNDNDTEKTNQSLGSIASESLVQGSFAQEVEPYLIQTYRENVQLFNNQFPEQKMQASTYASQMQDNLYLQYFISNEETKAFFQRLAHEVPSELSFRQALLHELDSLRDTALRNIDTEMMFVFQFSQQLIVDLKEMVRNKVEHLVKIDGEFNHALFSAQFNNPFFAQRQSQQLQSVKFKHSTQHLQQQKYKKLKEEQQQEKENKELSRVECIEETYMADQRLLIRNKQLRRLEQEEEQREEQKKCITEPNFMRLNKSNKKEDRALELSRREVQINQQKDVLRLISQQQVVNIKTTESVLKNQDQLLKLRQQRLLTPITMNMDRNSSNCSPLLKRYFQQYNQRSSSNNPQVQQHTGLSSTSSQFNRKLKRVVPTNGGAAHHVPSRYQVKTKKEGTPQSSRLYKSLGQQILRQNAIDSQLE